MHWHSKIPPVFATCSISSPPPWCLCRKCLAKQGKKLKKWQIFALLGFFVSYRIGFLSNAGRSFALLDSYWFPKIWENKTDFAALLFGILGILGSHSPPCRLSIYTMQQLVAMVQEKNICMSQVFQGFCWVFPLFNVDVLIKNDHEKHYVTDVKVMQRKSPRHPNISATKLTNLRNCRLSGCSLRPNKSAAWLAHSTVDYRVQIFLGNFFPFIWGIFFHFLVFVFSWW